MNNRFNALLIVVGLFSQSVTQISSEKVAWIVGVTAIISVLLSVLIARACYRLQANLDLLADLNDVTKAIRDKVDKGSKWNPAAYSWVKLQGYYIPITISLCLLGWTIYLFLFTSF